MTNPDLDEIYDKNTLEDTSGELEVQAAKVA
jgi:hypothetical protein